MQKTHLSKCGFAEYGVYWIFKMILSIILSDFENKCEMLKNLDGAT